MDVAHLLVAHWKNLETGNGRRKVQMALIVLLLSYTAGRPGALLETMCHPAEALKYKVMYLLLNIVALHKLTIGGLKEL